MSDEIDIVQLSKLQTVIRKDGTTIHTLIERDDDDHKTERQERWRGGYRIGRGGFGRVMLQRCVKGGDQGECRAVKVLDKPKRTSPAKEFRAELETLAKFSEEQYRRWFVQFLGWYEDSDSIYIAMEYCQFGDLHTHLDNGSSLTVAETRQVARQMLQALEQMHEAGFVHRDLKPGNILIKTRPPHTWWWEIKLADFGISKRVQDTHGPSTAKGTHGFMAPELLGLLESQRIGNANFMASDIWAAGEIIVRLLTGKPAFQGMRELSIYCSNSSTGPSSRFEVFLDEDCGDLIDGMMAAAPAARITAAEALQHDWLYYHTTSQNSQSSGFSYYSTTTFRPPNVSDVGYVPWTVFSAGNEEMPIPLNLPSTPGNEEMDPFDTSQQALYSIDTQYMPVSRLENTVERVDIETNVLEMTKPLDSRSEDTSTEPNDTPPKGMIRFADDRPHSHVQESPTTVAVDSEQISSYYELGHSKSSPSSDETEGQDAGIEQVSRSSEDDCEPNTVLFGQDASTPALESNDSTLEGSYSANESMTDGERATTVKSIHVAQQLLPGHGTTAIDVDISAISTRTAQQEYDDPKQSARAGEQNLAPPPSSTSVVKPSAAKPRSATTLVKGASPVRLSSMPRLVSSPRLTIPRNLLVASLPHPKGSIRDIVFSPNSEFFVILVLHGPAKLWTASRQRSRCRHLLTIDHVQAQGHENTAVFSPDSQVLAMRIRGARLGLWDTESLRCLKLIDRGVSIIKLLRISADNRWIAAVQERMTTVNHSRHTTMRTRYTGLTSDLDLRVWDIKSARLILTVELDTLPPVTDMWFSHDGRKICVRQKYFWNAALWPEAVMVYEVPSGKKVSTFPLPCSRWAEGSKATRKDMVVSNDFSTVACTDFCVAEKRTIVSSWNIEGNNVSLRHAHPYVGLLDCKISPDTNWVAVIYYEASKIRLCRTDTEMPLKMLDVSSDHGINRDYTVVVFSPDSRLLALQSLDYLCAWDVQTGAMMHESRTSIDGSLRTGVTSNKIQFSPDSSILIAEHSMSANVKIWDMTPKAPKRMRRHSRRETGLEKPLRSINSRDDKEPQDRSIISSRI